MKNLRRVLSVRLGEGHYLRLRRQSLRSGIPMSVLVRALVERWLDEQEQGEAPIEPPRPEVGQPSLLADEGGPR